MSALNHPYERYTALNENIQQVRFNFSKNQLEATNDGLEKGSSELDWYEIDDGVFKLDESHRNLEETSPNLLNK